MEAQEALVVGVLGLTSLYAWHCRRDVGDRWLAMAALWLCMTGAVGLVLAQSRGAEWSDALRLALRFSGPPVLLLVCEESVRSADELRGRRSSLLFAFVVWALASGTVLFTGGEPLLRFNVSWPSAAAVPLTSWMVLLSIATLTAVATVGSAVARGLRPGLAGWAALVLLASELWATLDFGWATGVLPWHRALTYRTMLTLFWALVAVVKALQPGAGWLVSAASRQQVESTSSPS